MRSSRLLSCLALCTVAACEGRMIAPEIESKLGYSGWSVAQSIELAPPGAVLEFNTSSLDGCPFIAPDGKTFYLASNRPDGVGGIDIWVATRKSPSEPWGEPVNVGAPVNSAADDFCPTLARDGHTLYFVSTRQGSVLGEDYCGGSDIYVARRRDDQGFESFESATHLGCEVNSSANEFSPFPVDNIGGVPGLFYSSTRPRTGATGGDLYFSEWRGNRYGAGAPVPNVNSDSDDGQPNVSRDGLELFFYSNRTDLPGPQGGNDLYVATRGSLAEPWSTPVNLGPNVNSPAPDTRPSLSWDGTTLYFGSGRTGGEGSTDIYVTTRNRVVVAGVQRP